MSNYKPINNIQEQYYDTKQASEYLGYTERSIRFAIKQKRINAIKIGRMFFMTKEDLDNRIDNRYKSE